MVQFNKNVFFAFHNYLSYIYTLIVNDILERKIKYLYPIICISFDLVLFIISNNVQLHKAGNFIFSFNKTVVKKKSNIIIVCIVIK